MPSDEAAPGDRDDAPRWARPFVWTLLITLLACGVSGVEAWPLSGFRLFSHLRTSHTVTWRLATVDPSGREHPLKFRSLPPGYRGLDLDLDEAAAGRSGDRDDLCLAVVAGARSSGRDVARVRVYRLDRDLSRRVGRTSAVAERVAFTCPDIGIHPRKVGDIDASR